MDLVEYSWKNYLRKILCTNVLNEGDVEWSVEAIWCIISDNRIKKPNSCIYRSLIYLNKNIRLGCFAFTFTENVIKAIKCRSVEKLYNAFMTDTLEYTSSYLTEEEKSRIQKEIRQESDILTTYFQGCKSCSQYKTEILFNKCVDDVLRKHGINPELICKKENIPIKIEDEGISYSYTLDELLLRIYQDQVNHYTNEPFSQNLKNFLTYRYPTLFKFVKIYKEKIP